MYYFLEEDFIALNAEIGKIADKIKELGKDMGKSCQEGAETFHDNFAYENGSREQYMWSGQIRKLIQIRNNARVVSKSDRSDNYKVSLGNIVTIEDEDTGEVRVITISSYMVFSQQTVGQEVISYNAPMSRVLIGKEVGETIEFVISKKSKNFRILKIE